MTEQSPGSSAKPSANRREEIRTRSHPLSLKFSYHPVSRARKSVWALHVRHSAPPGTLQLASLSKRGDTPSLVGFFWESKEIMHDFSNFSESMLTCLPSRPVQATSCNSRENRFQALPLAAFQTSHILLWQLINIHPSTPCVEHLASARILMNILFAQRWSTHEASPLAYQKAFRDKLTMAIYSFRICTFVEWPLWIVVGQAPATHWRISNK